MADEPNETLQNETATVPGGKAEPAEPSQGAEAAAGPAPIPVETAPAVAAQPDGDIEDALLEACSNCTVLLDVGDFEPFAKVQCPACGDTIRVRTHVKNFILAEVLGSGGMGAVYKALDTNLDRMIALKVIRKELSADAEYLTKFEREAQVTASVNHPNVVKVYSFGSDHGLYYIAMELVDKGSLDDLMNLQGRIAEIQGLNVGIQAAQGLQAAHQKGLIHRDMKPGNILFADAHTSKIVDFGLALLAAHEAEERGEIWGTPYYIAPERLDRAPEDLRSDIYSLGGTLFHAIAGRPPFEAETASMVALKHLKSKAVSLQAFAPDVSNATAYVINRMLSKDPEQRYQTYAELIEHLDYAKTQLAAAAGASRKPKERVVVEGAGQRKAMGIITLMLILLLLAIGAGIYQFHDRIFGKHETAASPGVAANALSPGQLDAQFAAARRQMVDGDFAGAMDTLKKIDDSDIVQPLQNWVTVNEGLDSLFQENVNDARDWFKVVDERSHYSRNPADRDLTDFFARLGIAMSSPKSISAGDGTSYALDSFPAVAPLLFALKDWSMGRFGDAGPLLAIYLSSTPKAPYEWISDYKPLAQKYADNEAAFETASAAAISADTPEKRANALKLVHDLEAKVKGRMSFELGALERDLLKRQER